MNLHEYYRNHKDAINASIMDIACDLAVGRTGKSYHHDSDTA